MLAKGIFFSACATVFAGTTYVVGIAMAPPPTYKVTDEQRINKFDEIAAEYERKTKKQEFYLGIGRWRRRILKDAHGRVLEVGAGTGSNLGIYPADRCDEVILCDRSPHMVEEAVKKIQARLGYHPFHFPEYIMTPQSSSSGEDSLSTTKTTTTFRSVEGKAAAAAAANAIASSDDCNQHSACIRAAQLSSGLSPITTDMHLTPEGESTVRARSAVIDAKRRARLEVEGKTATDHSSSSARTQSTATDDLYSVACYPAERLPFPDNSFDTVVDMFGLCSFDDPTTALTEMSRVCKPDGRILLLEHGKGSWEKMNGYLDKWAPRHASMWGCWWNRDIRRYIRLSGVELVHREEKHFGTSQYMVLRPYKSLAEKKEQLLLQQQQQPLLPSAAAEQPGSGKLKR